MSKFAVGVTSGGQFHSGSLPPQKTTRSLVSLCETHSFYTPALPMLFIPLAGRDPLATFCDEVNREVHPLLIPLPLPVFSGVPSVWAHTVFALPKTDFAEFHDWFTGSQFLVPTPAGYRMFRIGSKALSVNTNHTPKNPCKTFPDIRVTIFCVDGCMHATYFDDQGKLQRIAPFPDTVEFRNRFLQSHSNPLAAIEKSPEQELADNVQKQPRNKRETDGQSTNEKN